MIKTYIEQITTFKEFFALREEWETLEKYVSEITVFQTFVFQYYAWNIFSDKVALNILVIRNEAGEMIGCAPLGEQTIKAGPLKIKQLGFCCIKYCDFQNFIIHDEYKNDIFAALSEWFKNNKNRWDVIELKLLREDFSLCKFPELFLDTLPGISLKELGVAPYITIQPEWTDYQQALSTKRAKSVRYEVKNLFTQFEGEYKGFSEGKEFFTALEQLMDLHQKRIRQKHQLGAFATPAIRIRFKELTEKLAVKKYIQLHSISNEKQTIAVIGTFVYQHIVSYFQGGFDPEYNRLSPGKVVLALRITNAIETQAKEFDFLFGDEEYKFAWSSGQRKIFSIEIKTGSWKQSVYNKMRHFEHKLYNSEKLRALYLKFSVK